MFRPYSLLAVLVLMLVSSCALWVGDPYDPTDDTQDDTTTTIVNPPPDPFSFNTTMLFPFEDNSNWWHYTEAGGNTVLIEVTDTISDEGILYYRVSFKENRVDTTDDWFKRSSGQILFSPALISSYDLFLPARLDTTRGSFVSATGTVDYAFYDTWTADGSAYRNVVVLTYSLPILHGFGEIAFADSVGIIRLTDNQGRWPVTYEIDSCSVYGEVRSF